MWFLLTSVFSAIFIFSFSNVEGVERLFPDDIKRITLVTGVQYEFSVSFSSKEEQKLEGFIIQVHSQRHTLTLSESQQLVYGSYAEGKSIGLWKALSSENDISYNYYVNVSCGLYCNGKPENVTVLVAVVTVEANASIPGGCGMTSSLETDPNIQLNYTSYTTTMYFQDGNVGYNPRQESPKDCTRSYTYNVPTFKRVGYHIYHRILSVGDYSEDHMFSAIEDILDASSISKNKDDLPSFKIQSTGFKKVVIDSYEGDGVVYNVLAVVDGYPSTAYVPAVTYACEFVPGYSGCLKNLTTIKIIVGICGFLVGLFLLFAAHRLFHIEVYIFSSAISMFLCYLVVANVVSHDDEGVSVLAVRLSVSLVLALLCGGLLFIVWFFTGWYLPSVLLFTGCAGFMLMATLMFFLTFTSVDSLAILKISYVYFLLFGCVIVLVLIPAVIFPRALNIISSSVVGGYLVIFSIGLFVYTSLSEILMRVVKNATVKGYMKSEASYPFELKDYILIVVWFVLIVAGIIIQALLAYKRKPFPEKALYKQCMKKMNSKKGSSGERKRLLENYFTSSTENINF